MIWSVWAPGKVPRTNSEIDNSEYLIKAKIQKSERRGRSRISTACRPRGNGFIGLWTSEVKSISCLGLYSNHPLWTWHSQQANITSAPLLLCEHSCSGGWSLFFGSCGQLHATALHLVLLPNTAINYVSALWYKILICHNNVLFSLLLFPQELLLLSAGDSAHI